MSVRQSSHHPDSGSESNGNAALAAAPLLSKREERMKATLAFAETLDKPERRPDVAAVIRAFAKMRSHMPGDSILQEVSEIARGVPPGNRTGAEWYFLRASSVPGERINDMAAGPDRPRAATSYHTFHRMLSDDGATVHLLPIHIPKLVEIQMGGEAAANAATSFRVICEMDDSVGDTAFEFEFGKATPVPAKWLTMFLQYWPGCFVDVKIDGRRGQAKAG